MSYTRPPSSAVDFNQGALGYELVPQIAVDFTFVEVVAALGEIFPGGAENTVFGSNGIRNASESFKPTQFVSSVFGVPSLRNTRKIVSSAGAIGSRIVFGRPLVFNLRQYLFAGGVSAASYGVAYVQGGVKIVRPSGLASYLSGRPQVINTTADQAAEPAGIAPPVVGSASVSPRMLRPVAFNAGGYGFPVVQFPPQPRSWQSSVFGYPTIEDKTRRARGEGFDSFGTGYPVVRDRAQKVRHSASVVTSVFGDVAARLRSRRLVVGGFASLETSSFAEVRSTRRYLPAVGLYAGEFGAGEVRNKTPSVAPPGWLSLAWGGTGIGWRVRSVRLVGVPAPFAQLPQPSMWQTPGIKPAGIAPPAAPLPTVWPAIRAVSGLGADVARVGTATVGFACRAIFLEGMPAPAPGAQRVEHGNRAMLAAGAAHAFYGAPWVSFGLRALLPEGIKPPIDRSTPMVGGLRFVRPDGFVATRFGTRIIPEARVLYPLGFGGAFGLAAVYNRIRHLRPIGITTFPQPAQHWGVARLWNKRQYITQDYIDESDLTPPAWPVWTLIENRNKVMRVSGSAMSRMGAPQVDNCARAILAQGAITAAPSSAAMVAYRVRHLPLEGLEAPYITRWAVVTNNAVVLRPDGFMATAFGGAAAESNRRFITRAGAIFAQWFDQPFVAPRIRSVIADPRYSIAPPPIRPHGVQLLTRYVDADRGGIGPKDVGRASVTINWRGFTPRWTHRNFFGEPCVHNVTPQLGGRGWVAEEFGATGVRLQWRPVVVQGDSMALFGRGRVADKKQRVGVTGSDMLRIGDRLKVERFGVQPPGLQVISVLHAMNPRADFNFTDLTNQVPPPAFNQQVAYVYQSAPHTLWGNARLHANGIRVEPGYWDLLVGEPDVSHRHRAVLVAVFPDGEIFSPSKPRVSPHTVWAVMEAPDQAKRNHPEEGQLNYVSTGIVLGRASVTLRHRTIKPYGGAFSFIGGHQAWNSRQTVKVQGFLATRLGWHTVPGPRSVVIEEPSVTMAFGRPNVARPPYVGPLFIGASGNDTSLFGRGDVSHFHRHIYGVGLGALAMGGPLSGDKPYAWQGLRVGELMPTIPDGFAAEVFGTSWISLRVRGVLAEGTDMFASEYDYTQFAQRMRVRNTNTNEPPAQRITHQGHQSSKCGWQEVRPMRHYIRPDGNANQHRKGAPVT